MRADSAPKSMHSAPEGYSPERKDRGVAICGGVVPVRVAMGKGDVLKCLIPSRPRLPLLASCSSCPGCSIVPGCLVAPCCLRLRYREAASIRTPMAIAIIASAGKRISALDRRALENRHIADVLWA